MYPLIAGFRRELYLFTKSNTTPDLHTTNPTPTYPTAAATTTTTAPTPPPTAATTTTTTTECSEHEKPDEQEDLATSTSMDVGATLVVVKDSYTEEHSSNISEGETRREGDEDDGHRSASHVRKLHLETSLQRS